MTEQTPTRSPQSSAPAVNTAPMQQAPATHDPHAAQRVQDHKHTQEKRRADANKMLDDQQKAREDINADREQREANMKPTPTQRENDLAKLGLLDIDDKEDDGSGPEQLPNQPRREMTPDERARYKTRSK